MTLVVISYSLKPVKISYANGRVSVRIFYKNNLINANSFLSTRLLAYFFVFNFYIPNIQHQFFNYSFLIFYKISHLHNCTFIFYFLFCLHSNKTNIFYYYYQLRKCPYALDDEQNKLARTVSMQWLHKANNIVQLLKTVNKGMQHAQQFENAPQKV